MGVLDILRNRIRKYQTNKLLEKDQKAWDIMLTFWKADHIDEIKLAQAGVNGHINIGSSRMDPVTLESITDQYFLELMHQSGQSDFLTEEDVKEFWHESLSRYLDTLDPTLSLRWDKDELAYYIYNPYYGFCLACDKWMEWVDSSGESQWACSYCNSPIDLD